MDKMELIAAEHPCKIGAATGAPACVVITRYDVIRYVKAVEYALGNAQLMLKSKLSDVTGQYNKCQIIPAVDIQNRSAQILFRATIGRADMRIADESKNKRPLGLRKKRSGQEQENNPFFHPGNLRYM